MKSSVRGESEREIGERSWKTNFFSSPPSLGNLHICMGNRRREDNPTREEGGGKHIACLKDL